MFPNLPIELQAEIATYLDTPSLCFFARTSWRSLRAVQPYLIKRQQQLLRSPTVKLVASVGGLFCHTSKVIYACGANTSGLLGLGHLKDYTTLTRLPQQPSGIIRQVFFGVYHTLVLTDQGLYACGTNNFGQLGLEHTVICRTLTRLPQQPSGVILQVMASGLQTLVLTDQGLYACGDNRNGQLGLGHTEICRTFTRLRQQPSGVILRVMASGLQTLVLTDQGLYACGDMGHNETCTTLTRLPQQPSGVIRQVVAGLSNQTLVLTDQGLYACGENSHGELGLGYTKQCKALTRLPQQPSGVILQVVVGVYHTLVLTDQGLYACGLNTSGQLGLGHTKTCTTLTCLPQQPSGVIRQVVVGVYHTLVLTDQGLYACGDNSHVGHNETYTTLTRLRQQPPGIILQVVAGESHTLVLTDQGLYACGENRHGQLGLGHTHSRMALTLVDQVPSELRQFQALYRQLNALIRFSQTESPCPQLEALNPNGNSLPKANKSSRTESDDGESFPKRTKFFP